MFLYSFLFPSGLTGDSSVCVLRAHGKDFMYSVMLMFKTNKYTHTPASLSAMRLNKVPMLHLPMILFDHLQCDVVERGRPRPAARKVK